MARTYADDTQSDVMMRLAIHNNLALAHFSAGDDVLVQRHADAAMEVLKQIDRTDFASGIANLLHHTAGTSPTNDVWASERTARDFIRSQHIELGAYLEAPTLCAAAALKLAQRDNPAAGAALLDDALETARATEERWYEAELLRLKAEAALEAGLIDQHQAVQFLGQAGETARAQHAKLFELRSAISLARVWRTQSGRGGEIHDMLKSLLDRFATEGEPPELAEAQIVLDETLSSHSPLS